MSVDHVRAEVRAIAVGPEVQNRDVLHVLSFRGVGVPPTRTQGASVQTGYGRGPAGTTWPWVSKTDSSRTVEQELASGESEATPFIALGSVVVVIAALVAVAVALAALAYFLA